MENEAACFSRIDIGRRLSIFFISLLNVKYCDVWNWIILSNLIVFDQLFDVFRYFFTN